MIAKKLKKSLFNKKKSQIIPEYHLIYNATPFRLSFEMLLERFEEV